MRDRLIELLVKTQVECYSISPVWLADHLIANGVICPPCKVGDTVYYPSFNIGMVFSYKVVSIKLNSKGLYIVLDSRLRNEQMTHRATQIGKTVFLTREEAEAKLKECEGK